MWYGMMQATSGTQWFVEMLQTLKSAAAISLLKQVHLERGGRATLGEPALVVASMEEPAQQVVEVTIA
jgi:hypothetical protein